MLAIEHRLMYDLKFKVEKITENARSPLTSYKVRSGKDVSIVATSIMVLEAERAADYLAKERV